MNNNVSVRICIYMYTVDNIHTIKWDGLYTKLCYSRYKSLHSTITKLLKRCCSITFLWGIALCTAFYMVGYSLWVYNSVYFTARDTVYIINIRGFLITLYTAFNQDCYVSRNIVDYEKLTVSSTERKVHSLWCHCITYHGHINIECENWEHACTSGTWWW